MSGIRERPPRDLQLEKKNSLRFCHPERSEPAAELSEELALSESNEPMHFLSIS